MRTFESKGKVEVQGRSGAEGVHDGREGGTNGVRSTRRQVSRIEAGQFLGEIGLLLGQVCGAAPKARAHRRTEF